MRVTSSLSDYCSGRLRQELFHQYCTCSSGRERCSRTSDRAFVLDFTILLVQTLNKIRLMMLFETLWNYVIDLYTLPCAVERKQGIWLVPSAWDNKTHFERKKMLILCSYCEVPQFRLRESSWNWCLGRSSSNWWLFKSKGISQTW